MVLERLGVVFVCLFCCIFFCPDTSPTCIASVSLEAETHQCVSVEGNAGFEVLNLIFLSYFLVYSSSSFVFDLKKRSKTEMMNKMTSWPLTIIFKWYKLSQNHPKIRHIYAVQIFSQWKCVNYWSNELTCHLLCLNLSRMYT